MLAAKYKLTPNEGYGLKSKLPALKCLIAVINYLIKAKSTDMYEVTDVGCN